MTAQAHEPTPSFDPEANPVLYHYCSTDTFLSIIGNRCIWMSDVNTMNDFGEMHWAYERFEEAASSVLQTVGREFLDAVDSVIATTQLRILPMLAAFSTDGDVLSQWRAYADDGAGIALGFDATKISTLSVRIAPVEYSREKQVEHFVITLLAMYEVYNDMGENEREKFLVDYGSYFAVDLAFFKNPAFSEEKEVRIVRAVNVSNAGGTWKLTDNGGSGERVSKKKLPVRFRAGRNGGIISHIEMPLSGLGNNFVKEVVIGPRSVNNGVEVSMALTGHDYTGFKIVKSRATYR